MKREEIEKFLNQWLDLYKSLNELKPGDADSGIFLVNNTKGYMDKLQADLLEAYKAIVELGIHNKHHDQFGIWEHCQCGQHNMYNTLESINHRKDCIVNKAEKYIGDNE